jgi:hypothetical protein
MILAPRARRALAVGAVAAILAACATEPLPGDDAVPPLPVNLASVRDLRGLYRAALCQREAMGDAQCARTLYRFAGEPSAARPPAADASQFRLVFVPGFLASCFPGIHTFGDVMPAARAQGFAVDYVNVGGRSGVDHNAVELGHAIDQLPHDSRRLVIIGHSKGAVDVVALLAARPDIANRTAAVLSVAGAFMGSPLADHLDGLYRVTFGAVPFSACSKGPGDPVLDLQRAYRRAWWEQHGATVRVPVYSLVSVPEMTRLALPLYTPFLALLHLTRYNDGMLLARDEVVPSGALLGVVNADHLSIGIPRPDMLPYRLWFSPEPFPRTDVILAAIDVIAADAR